jgi:hypothetical protein
MHLHHGISVLRPCALIARQSCMTRAMSMWSLTSAKDKGGILSQCGEDHHPKHAKVVKSSRGYTSRYRKRVASGIQFVHQVERGSEGRAVGQAGGDVENGTNASERRGKQQQFGNAHLHSVRESKCGGKSGQWTHIARQP